MKTYAGRALALALVAAPLPALAQDGTTEAVVAVGGNQLSVACHGAGPKTVLLVAGMGLDARTTYKNTFRNFSEPGYQICMYDRAGYGKSSPLTAPRPLKALSDELDGLIRARQWQDVVLVAHSFGGLVGRYYATTHPGTVKGLVLVDAVHESWYGGLQKALSADGWRIMQMIIRWERDKNSHEDFVEGSTTMAAAVAPLAMPVTVLSRGLPLTNIRQAKMSYDDVDAFNASWDVAQFELARATGGRHVRMRYASHQFDEQDPWIVLEEISALLKRMSTAARN